MPSTEGIPSATELQLMSLVVRRRTGREVRQLYEAETGKPLSPGTLFTTFRRLRERKWVAVETGYDEDGRVRSFQLTGAGVAAVERARDHYRDLAVFGAHLAGPTGYGCPS